MGTSIQRELNNSSPLLDADGNLVQVGWSRQPLLDCNLENARFYSTRFLQRFRIKRWDYYGIITPKRFYSFTLADLGYAGQVFAYIIELDTGQYHEETLTIPFGHGITLPCNSLPGKEARSYFDNGRVKMEFQAEEACRKVMVQWPGFWGKSLSAELSFQLPPDHESMVIVIPIGKKRFYYNRKINCMPAEGWIEQGGEKVQISPADSLGNLDWGRGVWEYRSFWVWASASGYLKDNRTIGLNLGFGFGDTSAATENALVLNGRIHKFGSVDFRYSSDNFKQPWKIISPDGRLDLVFTPSIERVAKTNLGLIFSEVHQMFGHYDGSAITDEGEKIIIEQLTGFAEEHHARW